MEKPTITNLTDKEVKLLNRCMIEYKMSFIEGLECVDATRRYRHEINITKIVNEAERIVSGCEV
jgi:hypothetical protein